MKIHYLQHIHFEGLGLIGEWAQKHGAELSHTKTYMEEQLPDSINFDVLIILGGPMSTYETDKYPWLIKEKEFIRKTIGANKKILGICLGAQLLAEALNAKVYRSQQKEIGFFEIQKSNNTNLIIKSFPESLITFHWHGDTFDIPNGAEPLFYSKATPNQAFSFKNQAIAFQFHIEMNEENIKDITSECINELEPADYVFSAPEIIRNMYKIKDANRILFEFLDNWLRI